MMIISSRPDLERHSEEQGLPAAQEGHGAAGPESSQAGDTVASDH